MPACMLFCINCSHSVGICGGQLKPESELGRVKLVTMFFVVSLTSRRELGQVVLVLSMARLRRIWLWGILLETGQIPARRRRSMLLLAILVRTVWRLHLRKWKWKGHPGWVVAVVRHCGKERSASRDGALRAVQRIEQKRILSMTDCTVMRHARSNECAFTLRFRWLRLAVAGESGRSGW